MHRVSREVASFERPAEQVQAALRTALLVGQNSVEFMVYSKVSVVKRKDANGVNGKILWKNKNTDPQVSGLRPCHLQQRIIQYSVNSPSRERIPDHEARTDHHELVSVRSTKS